MEQVKLNLNLPYVEKDIIDYYQKNMKVVKGMLQKVLGREMDDSENHRLKRICMEYAVDQVTIKYKDKLGINNKENDE